MSEPRRHAAGRGDAPAGRRPRPERERRRQEPPAARPLCRAPTGGSAASGTSLASAAGARRSGRRAERPRRLAGVDEAAAPRPAPPPRRGRRRGPCPRPPAPPAGSRRTRRPAPGGTPRRARQRAAAARRRRGRRRRQQLPGQQRKRQPARYTERRDRRAADRRSGPRDAGGRCQISSRRGASSGPPAAGRRDCSRPRPPFRPRGSAARRRTASAGAAAAAAAAAAPRARMRAARARAPPRGAGGAPDERDEAQRRAAPGSEPDDEPGRRASSRPRLRRQRAAARRASGQQPARAASGRSTMSSPGRRPCWHSITSSWGCSPSTALHRLLLVVLVPAHPRGAGPSAPPDPADWPVVTVQLPLYNEMYVAARLIDAVCAPRLPARPPGDPGARRLDRRDHRRSSPRVVAEQRGARGRRPPPAPHRPRAASRPARWPPASRAARGELIAVFDADFVPRAGLPAPHGPATSPIPASAWCRRAGRTSTAATRCSPGSQAILLDGHFLIEHTARHRSGCFFNFNGTAGVWRRAGDRERRRLAARHPDRGPRPLLPRAARAAGASSTCPTWRSPPSCRSTSTASRASSTAGPRARSRPAASCSARILRAPLPLAGQARGLRPPHQQRQLPPDGAARRCSSSRPCCCAASDLERGCCCVDLPLFLGGDGLGRWSSTWRARSRAGPAAGGGELRYLPALMGARHRPLGQQRPRRALRALPARRHLPPHAQVPHRAPGRGLARASATAPAQTSLVPLEGALALYFLGCSVYAVVERDVARRSPSSASSSRATATWPSCRRSCRRCASAERRAAAPSRREASGRRAAQPPAC